MARTPGSSQRRLRLLQLVPEQPGERPDGTEGRLPFPSTPRSSVTFQGNGVNAVYLDWEHDLVVVVRWIDSNESLDQFLGKVIAAITSS